jgi:NADH dehydrogenase
VGRSLTARLTALGHAVLIPSRHDAYHRDATSPQNHWLKGDIHNADFLNACCTTVGPHGIVINLVGLLHDKPGIPYGAQFRAAHVTLVRSIIAAMHQHGLRRLLHMSALGADSHGPSMYQRSKGDGEVLVSDSGLDWTIFRPSVIFGQEDNFINLFAKLSRFLPLIPLANAEARFQPVNVEDVAEAFARAIALPNTIGKCFDLVGPQAFTLAQLVQLSGKRIGHQRRIIPLPDWVGKLQARLFELMPGTPLMSRDNIASMQLDNVLPTGGVNALTEILGITPQPLESLAL